ncbi:hypothetical protein A2716_00100 [candidate division WWE3 bacterium RIFCSPHIGHO2_01_FULL_40_23]|nr:MAG: hypothetical protein A2716_00100 [candidate division WWE3 bacterium RIFCSPHIGHO2_01_FULL_40_23]
MDGIVENPNNFYENQKPKSSITSFFSTVIKESIKWFFKGLGNCVSMVVGYFMIFLLIIASISLLSQGSSKTSEFDGLGQELYRDYGGDDKIALIELSGLILERDALSNPISGTRDTITPDKVEKSLNRARDDSNVKAVILMVSSPGGSPVASDRIYEVIQDFRKNYKIPVVVLMGDVAASGGYYISAPADYIFANPSTITGSIGVILESYNLSSLYEKIGVKKETFKAGKYKDILSDSREITPEERIMINDLMQDAYETFVSRVAEGRNIPVNTVRSVADGKIYSGVGAKEVKLIDDTGNLDSTLAFTAKKAGLEKYKVVKIKTSSIFTELFTGVSYALYNSGLNLGVVGINQPKYQILYKMP